MATNDVPTRLWEACVAADWASVDTLCDEYERCTKSTSLNYVGSPPSDNHGRSNPLMAAVLHVAIDMAVAHGSFSLFSEAVPPEAVEAAERSRRRAGGLDARGDPITADDFCPYRMMRKCNDADHPVVDEAHRRARRTAIARLCRANPSWIVLPMVPRDSMSSGEREERGANDDDARARGTTPLHVAVRSRCVALTRLLLKYCPKSAEVADVDGCLPLHFAARPSDEPSVLRRAVLTYQRGLNQGLHPDAPLDVGPNEVHSGVNLYWRGKEVFKATHESSEMARCRCKRLWRRHKAKQLKDKMAQMEGTRAAKHNEGSGLATNAIHNRDAEKRTSTEERDPFADMYATPSSLVRALMHLGTVEEDSADLVKNEWTLNEENAEEHALQSRRHCLARDFPIVVSASRTVTAGLGRPTRAWRTERHRIDVVKLLASIYPSGVSANNCDEGGITPLHVACHTLLGDDGGDAEMDAAALLGPLHDDEVDDEHENDDDGNGPIPDEVGEDDADYEEHLPQNDGARSHHDGGFGDANNERPMNPDQDQDDDASDEDGGEDDPLEAAFFMIANGRNDAVETIDDDGNTGLHAATRIGASPRLIRRLLHVTPDELVSTPAEDGSTPLHLACRRACDLAPEGNGGMGAYGSTVIRLLADAAGPCTIVAPDNEGRTPFHVACRYKAAPAVLAELADADGGRKSLLIRDSEGHTPLGVYCHHASDYHGLRVLVERCPEAAAAVGDGRRLPLHRILSEFNLAVNWDCIKLLGTAYPPALDMVDGAGMTPLALLCQSYRSPLRVDIPKLRDGTTTLQRCLSRKIWLMAQYLILAANTNRHWKEQSDVQDGPELMLHATLREPSSSIEIVEMASLLHPDQIGSRDINGDTPLHLCCKRRHSVQSPDASPGGDSVFKRVNEGIRIKEITVEADSSKQREHDPNRDYLRILHYILQCDVSAAGRCNKKGKYAFDLLVDTKSTWKGGGIDRVLKASPQALLSYELSNGLFALALARIASYEVCSDPDRNRDEQTSCLGALFQLLRGKPTALESACLNSAGRASKRSRRSE